MPGKQVFLYGTLRYLPLLEVVVGGSVETHAASLDGHVAVHAGTENFPILVAREGARAPGILAWLDEEQIARVDFYEGPEGYALRPIAVDTHEGSVEAWSYLPDLALWTAGADWDLSAWQEGWGDITTRAVAEMMAARDAGQTAAEVDARHGMIMARAQAYGNTARWRRTRSVGAPMGRSKVSRVGQANEHMGFFTLETIDVRHARFDGGPEMAVSRAVFRAGEAVTLLPYDPVRDRVLLLEQFRAAPYAQGDPEPWMLEPIAGIVDAGETVEQSARREAMEEAGLSVQTLHFIARYYPSPGATAQVLYSYATLVDLPGSMAESGGLQDEGEDIAVHLVDFDHAMAMVESGEIAVAPLIISLQWLAAHRESLRGAG